MVADRRTDPYDAHMQATKEGTRVMGSAVARLLTLALLTSVLGGCFYTSRARTLSQRSGEQAFEDWRVSVHGYAHPKQSWEKGEETAANHTFTLWCAARTTDRDYGASLTPDWESRSRYVARIDSFILSHMVDGEEVAVSMPEMRAASGAGWTRMAPHGGKVLIQPSVRRLLATVTITFTPKDGGEPVTKVFRVKLSKIENTRIEPLTV
jgi:hypothetical protein